MNNDDEKFGVKIIAEFIQSSFSSALNKIKTFENSVKDVKVGFSTDETELAYVKSQIDDIEEKLRLAGEGYEVGDIYKLDYQLSKLQERYKEIQDRVKQINIDTKQWNKNLNNITKPVKRFALALVGIRSIYFGIRRAMSTYLSQNEELQNKLNGAYYALGSLFAPVLEKILNIFIKLVSYVDVFVKALGFAGINMSKFAKSAGSAKKSLAGFDEINNLSDAGGGASVSDPFKDVKLDTGWVDRLQNFAVFIKDNLPVILGLLAGVITFVELLKKGFNLEGASGIALVITGIVTALGGLLNYLKDPSWKNFGTILIGIGEALVGIGILAGSWPLAIAGAVALALGVIAKYKDQIFDFLNDVSKKIGDALNWVHTNITEKFGIIGAVIGSAIEIVLTLVKSLVENVKLFIDGLLNGLKTILDGFILFFKGDFQGGIQQIWEGIKTIFTTALTVISNLIKTTWNTIKTTTTTIFNSIKTTIINIFNGIWSGIKGIINKILGGFESFVNGAIDAVNSLIGGLMKVGSKIGKIFGLDIPSKIGHVSIPRLATGTNYVPNDTFAYLHKGEAVVPKKFNSNEYFNNDNEETNKLLRQLIDVVDSKEFRAYISQKDIGKSAVDYINNQSRIMGASII